MPARSSSAAELDDIVDFIRGSKPCTPIVGNQLVLSMLLGDEPLAPRWADYMAQKVRTVYPLEDCSSLSRLAQFYSVWDDTTRPRYLNFLKAEFLKVYEEGYKAGRFFISPTQVRSAARPGASFTEVVADCACHPDFASPQGGGVGPADTAADTGEAQEGGAGRNNPLCILADFDSDVFVTTSPHYLLEHALEKVGKTPRAEVYPWTKGVSMDVPRAYKPPEDYEPDITAPLVYHLFGVDNDSQYLVLSEDDHIEFMLQAHHWANVSQSAGCGAPSTGTLNAFVRTALASNPLLLIGYEINGWDLRALLSGLLAAMGRKDNRERCLAIQVYPPENEKVRDPDGYQSYLERLFDEQFKVQIFWERPEDFMIELRDLAGT
jgi:hypothetical protein